MTPKELGELGDEYWKTRELRLAADRTARELKEQESALFARVIEVMRNENITVIGGQQVRLTLEETDEPIVKSWEEFYDHLLLTKQFDLLQRRLSGAAVKERWQAGVEIPGVGEYPVFKLSKSKL